MKDDNGRAETVFIRFLQNSQNLEKEYRISEKKESAMGTEMQMVSRSLVGWVTTRASCSNT